MSIDISLEKQADPFYKAERCSKCDGKIGLRIQSTPGGGSRTIQICRSCGHEVPTAFVNVIRVK